MPSGRVPKVYGADLVAMVKWRYVLGMSQAEVAVTLGLTQKVVWNLMRRHAIKARPQIKRNQLGSRNTTWRGSRAGYQALHVRVAVQRGKPSRCETCGINDQNKHYDWANLTGRYDDPTDYRRLCRSCHAKLDQTIRNIIGETSR